MNVEKIKKVLEYEIEHTPTGHSRNILTDANIIIQSLSKQVEELTKENERLKTEKRQIVLELSDEEYIVVSEKEYDEIVKSAYEFDGFLGCVGIGKLDEIIKAKTQLEDRIKELEQSNKQLDSERHDYIECSGCDWKGYEDDLILEPLTEGQNHSEYALCPKCKTDLS